MITSSDTRAQSERLDRLIALVAGLTALGVYLATLLPGIGSGDTAEFQRVLPTLGVAHPTGYPLYTILGWLWSWLPLGMPAWRINLFSAVAAALAIGVVYLVARGVGQARGVAVAVALALAVSRTFWSQATLAEVYALALLLLALLLLALLRWRAGCWPMWPIGLLFGLGLAHHRTIILLIPGALIFILLEYVTARRANGADVRTCSSGSLRSAPALRLISSRRDVGLAALAILPGCLLYLYLPLRAPDWLDSWRTFARVVGGSDALSAWLQVAEPARVALDHLRELATRWIWPQFLPFGALLALIGLAGVWRRDRALAALLTLSYGLVLLFCVLFFVQDVEVFLLSAHLIAALLIGEGAMVVLRALSLYWTRRHGDRETQSSWHFAPGLPVSLSPNLALFAWLLLLLPALLFFANLPAIRAANTDMAELAARALLAQPLPPGALLIVDWESVEGLRYLQALEGQRADIEVRPLNESVVRSDVDAALAAGRATYLLRAQPNLGLAQRPEGRLWRVEDQPLQLAAATPTDRRWQDGLLLRGYTLAPGPYYPGEIVPVTLAWSASGAAHGRYTLFVHLIGADGALWGQHDREPQPLPTDQWPDRAQFADLYGPTLRLDTPPGRYQVVVGWYSYPSLARLPLAGDGGDALVLGQIEVAPLQSQRQSP